MNLKKFWYPVLMSKQLPKDKLVSIKLFGQPFVLYRDESNNPVCLEDRCPHRGTPLSLGRVSNGQLECRYHGWRFGRSGACVKIPTHEQNKQIPVSANANKRECKDLYDTIWIYPIQCSSQDIPPFHEHLFPILKTGKPLYMLSSWDVNVPYDLFLENLIDLSHLPFVHHNTLSKRSKAQPITFELIEDKNSVISGRAHYHKFQNPRFEEIYNFIAPCLVQYDFINKKTGYKKSTQFYCTPMDREMTRVFCYTHVAISQFIFKLLNNRLVHILSKPMVKIIANQDVPILQGQHKNRELGVSLANQPTQADLLASYYRRWVVENNIDAYWFQGYEQKKQYIEASLAIPE